MREGQIWQLKELGSGEDALKAVIYEFRTKGVQGIESQQALTAYIGNLKDEELRKMCIIDREAALQILADCFGVVYAAEKYGEWKKECEILLYEHKREEAKGEKGK